MANDKDSEQDAMIRRNAENIRRNEEAIVRQTEYLQQIRDHYFPKKTLWKSVCGFVLKVVGAVTIATGVMETLEWYWNERQTAGLAEQSAQVARRLFFQENDIAGALRFYEKAVELESGKPKYRIELAYAKGLAAMIDFFELERPLTAAERARVDAIMAEAAFLQTAAPDDPMPYVLAARAYALRNEKEAAGRAIDKALELGPELVLVRISACVIRFSGGDFPAAKRELDAAERLDPNAPGISYWKGMLADVADHDQVRARREFAEMVRRFPGNAAGHAALGWQLMVGKAPDLAGARVEFRRALAIMPSLKGAMRLMAESYEREGDSVLARLWCDRALEQDETFMTALTLRARVCGKAGDWQTAVADLTKAIGLAPFRGDLYRARAKAWTALGERTDAAEDLKKADALDRANGTKESGK